MLTNRITSRSPEWVRRVVDVELSMDWDGDGTPKSAPWAVPALRFLIETALLAIMAAVVALVVQVVLAVTS